jgi:ankyrin repeat protein
MADLDLLSEAAQHENCKTVQPPLGRNQEVVSERAASGATALQYTAFNGYGQIAKLLVERGADIKNRDRKFGATPTVWAIEYFRELGGYLARVARLGWRFTTASG